MAARFLKPLTTEENGKQANREKGKETNDEDPLGGYLTLYRDSLTLPDKKSSGLIKTTPEASNKGGGGEIKTFGKETTSDFKFLAPNQAPRDLPNKRCLEGGLPENRSRKKEGVTGKGGKVALYRQKIEGNLCKRAQTHAKG